VWTKIIGCPQTGQIISFLDMAFLQPWHPGYGVIILAMASFRVDRDQLAQAM
jgi:hypothetical protein